MWVARYGSYPVIWTLAQECDKDFYGKFNAETNPYKKLCELIYELDPYKHPISGHQENSAITACSDSAFRDVTGHTFYAAQWSMPLKDEQSFHDAKDYWENSDGKPTILYESLYDHLWTTSYGARAEGWLAFLNGMLGYGYGAQDIWYYKPTYDMDTDSVYHGITVTKTTKQIKWSNSYKLESAIQMGYLAEFMDGIEWWKLTPRFDSTDWFSPSKSVPYSLATIDNDAYVFYFYGDQTTETGEARNLQKNTTYTLTWYNPQTGEWRNTKAFTTGTGKYKLPEKPTNDDWVLYIEKVK